MNSDLNPKPILVLGATGKTGRRVAARLVERGLAVRPGSRAGQPPFDWERRETWEGALRGVSSVYLSYYPDLGVAEAEEAVRSFAEAARVGGMKKVVLLSGRGEEGAERAERAVHASGIPWTVLRASWFSQNFSESFLLDAVRAGEVALPVGAVKEPFIDVEDIADAAVAALTQEGHDGRTYELTGPELMTFEDAVEIIGRASGRKIRYAEIAPQEFEEGLVQQQVPSEFVALLRYLFLEVLDGRNERTTDGVDRLLGRRGRTFADYAKRTAATGVWAAA